MTRAVTAFSVLLCSVLAAFSSNAQQIYIGTDIGFGPGNSLETSASDTDFPTLCDKHLDPDNLFSPAGITEPDGCHSAASTWSNRFDGSTGRISGVALGFSTDAGARFETEYFNFGAQYDATSAVGGAGSDVQDKLNQEFLRADERIGEVNIHNLFFNVSYDVPFPGNLRPYLGAGAGLALAAMDYDGVFARNLNPDAIRTADGATYNGQGDENVDRRALHERIAGTTSTASHTLKDRVFGFQVLAGVDYKLNDNTSIGIKGRWVNYAGFSDGNEWDQIRSHSSDNGPGTHTVTYTIATDDLSFFGVSVGLKHTF